MNLTKTVKSYFITITTIIILLISSEISHAQMYRNELKPDKKFANYCLKFNNYHDGLKEFNALLKLKPDNDYYRWGIGYCHLHLNIDKSSAIPFFKTVLSKENADQAVWYDLGDAYFQTENLDEAEKAFNNYIKSEINDKHEISALRKLEMISNARKSIKNPINVTITNLGKGINSTYPDILPYINSTEKFMIFSRQAKANSGRYRNEDGYYAGDLYYSNFKFGRWRRIKRFSSIINTQAVELNGYLSKNASFLYVNRKSLFGNEVNHLIYNKRGRSFGHPKEVIIPEIDMKEVKTIAISNDNKWLIYSAPTTAEHRKDLDLFFCKKLATGEWSEARAFDSTINTIYNEAHPYFTPNKNKIVFASKGHNSIGGYDLFTSDIQIDTMLHTSNISNLGYPVNTTMDDITISFNDNFRYAYISSLREGGIGNLDIYRVVFEDQQPLFTVIHGGVFDQDSIDFRETVKEINEHIDTLNFPINKEYKRILLKKKDSIAANKYLADNKIPYEKLAINIKAINKKDNKIIGHFIVKEKSATYAVILPPGDYKLIFSRKDFDDRIIDNIKVEDYDLRNRNLVKHILLNRN